MTRENAREFMEDGAIKTAEQEITERLTEELKVLATEAEDLIKSKGVNLGKTREIRDRLASVLETAQDTVESLESQTVAGVRAADRAIRNHPYQAAGIALGVGLVVGWLLKRR